VVAELLVARALRSRHIRAISIYGATDRTGDFTKRLRRAARKLFLPRPPRPSVARKAAKDGGADIIAHCDLLDARCYASPIMVGQVTCAKSDEWDRKSGETSPSAFQRWLLLNTRPIVFFAVPHHIEDTTPKFLSQQRDGVIFLDRLRLARPLAAVGLPTSGARLVADLRTVTLTVGSSLVSRRVRQVAP